MIEIILISFLVKKLSSLSPLPTCGERVRVRGLRVKK